MDFDAAKSKNPGKKYVIKFRHSLFQGIQAWIHISKKLEAKNEYFKYCKNGDNGENVSIQDKKGGKKGGWKNKNKKVEISECALQQPKYLKIIWCQKKQDDVQQCKQKSINLMSLCQFVLFCIFMYYVLIHFIHVHCINLSVVIFVKFALWLG